DVDKREWAYDKPISCAVWTDLFSDDGRQIYYSTDQDNNGILWVYSLETTSSRELYETSGGTDLNPTGIAFIQWSPTRAYLIFGEYLSIVGGSLNTLDIMDMKTENTVALDAPDPYYASYDPIWSAHDGWF